MRLRTAKAVASRIDLSYFKRPHPLRRARTVAIVVCVLAAAGWAAYAVGRGDQRVFNPGPVTASHATFENNCTVCHAGDGGDGFLSKNVNTYRVTDAACLQCHDGTIHHGNQVQFVSSGTAGAAGGAHSTNCTACHSEHRGHESLTAASDIHCLQCHQDLSAGRTKTPPKVQASITGFEAPGSHPEFGRWLAQQGDGGWKDPTRVYFNHARPEHRDIKPLAGNANNCTVCHSLGSSGGTTAGHPGHGGDRRYTTPVNYEQHCASCHPLNLAAGGVVVPLAHESLDVVRGQLAGVDEALRQWLASLPPEARAGQLTTTETDEFGTETTTTKTADEWVASKMDALSAQLRSDLEGATDAEVPGRSALLALPAPAAGGKPDPSLLEASVAYRAASRCAKCHDMNGGDVPAVFRQKAGLTAAAPAPAAPDASAPPDPAAPATAAAAPATSPATQPVLLATLPTGIPSSSPRRWFPGSQFDHDAHRSLTCLECHAQALTSSKTTDVLMPAKQSCVQCHHTPTTASRGAGVDCQTCHLYHDRKLERSADGPFTAKELLAPPVNRSQAPRPAPTTRPAETQPVALGMNKPQ